MWLLYWMRSEAWKVFAFIIALVPTQDWKQSSPRCSLKRGSDGQKAWKILNKKRKRKDSSQQCNHVSVKHWVWQLIIDHGSLSLSFSCILGLCVSAKHHARVNQVSASTWGVSYLSLMDPVQLECSSFSPGLVLHIIRHTLQSAGSSAGCNRFLLLLCCALTTHPCHRASCQWQQAEFVWKQSTGILQLSCTCTTAMPSAFLPGCSLKSLSIHASYCVLLVITTRRQIQDSPAYYLPKFCGEAWKSWVRLGQGFSILRHFQEMSIYQKAKHTLFCFL